MKTVDYPPVRIDLQLGRATGLGTDRLTATEGAIGGTNADVILGGPGPNMFYLSDDADDYLVDDSDDTGPPPTRIDLIDGRGGLDTIGPSYFGCCGINVDLAKQTAKMSMDEGSAHLVSIEGAEGTWDNDDLRGDDGPNTFYGLEGPDLIYGRGGADRIWGDGGGEEVNTSGDKLFGGNGNDLINAGTGRDKVHGGPGDDLINGGSGRDRIYGNSGRDRINGGSGKDRLYGGSGRDRLRGGSGADRLDGGAGPDTCTSPSRGPRVRRCG